MPMVPVVQQNTSEAPPLQAPGVAPMRNFAPEQAQQAGATMQQAGEQSMRTNQEIQLRIQAQMDDANVKAAESKFIQSASATVTDYTSKRGADAVNGYDDAAGSLVKAKKDILESLGNDVQKHIFNQVSQQHLVTLGAQMGQHRNQQRVEYTATQSFSRADSMRSMWQNSEIESADQNRYIDTAVSETLDGLSIKGVPRDSDQAKEAERKVRSQAVTDNVSRFAEDGKYTEASAYLTKEIEAGHVEGDTSDRLRRVIRGNLQRTENITQAENIFAPYAGKELQSGDLDAMMKEAAKIDNPEQREHVQDMVHAKFNEQHSMQAMQYRETLNYAVDYKAEHGSLKGVDAVKWGLLRKSDQADLMKPPAVETDRDTWYKFVTQPESLTNANVNEAFSKGLLSKGDWKNFTEMAVRQKNKPDKVIEATADHERIKFYADQAGLNVYAAENEDQKRDYAGLVMRIKTDIDQMQTQKGGKATQSEKDDVIKRNLMQFQVQGVGRSWYNPARWFGSSTDMSETVTKRAYQLQQGDVIAVPAVARQSIIDSAKKHGVPNPTEEQIRNAYFAMKMGGLAQ